MKRKSTMQLIVTLALVIAGFFVILEVIREKVLGEADIATKEMACELMNELSGNTDLNTLQKASMRACTTIDLGNLPMRGYEKSKKGIMENIADKIARAWKIWREGRQENNFAGTMWGVDGTIHRDIQRCFPQYTFGIKKGLEPIDKDEFIEYLNDNLYKIDDTSDRCAGIKGGFCQKECEPDEKKVEAAKTCIGEKGICCLKSTPCESKGGECEEPPCSAGKTSYTNLKWGCGAGKICCIDDNNYVTYNQYIQANTGYIRVETPTFYPQDYKTASGEKKSETYAIVFSSRTTVALEFEEEKNVNNILIAPLDKVSDYCIIQNPTWA